MTTEAVPLVATGDSARGERQRVSSASLCESFMRSLQAYYGSDEVAWAEALVEAAAGGRLYAPPVNVLGLVGVKVSEFRLAGVSSPLIGLCREQARKRSCAGSGIVMFEVRDGQLTLDGPEGVLCMLPAASVVESMRDSVRAGRVGSEVVKWLLGRVWPEGG